MLAQITNHCVDKLIGNFGDTHLYNNHIEYALQQIERTPKQLPILKLNRNIKSIYDFKFEDFKIINYNAEPNWKNVPIAV
jgi:thymidylate synthase